MNNLTELIEKHKLGFVAKSTLQAFHLDAFEAGRDQGRNELSKCVNITADGKPVVLGSTLYLFPVDDVTREPMELKVREQFRYCWYNSVEDARLAAINKQK